MHPALTLQRALGNRATRQVVQRFVLGPERFQAQKNTPRTKQSQDIFDEIEHFIDRLHKATDDDSRDAVIMPLEKLSRQWISVCATSAPPADVALVRKLQTELERHKRGKAYIAKIANRGFKWGYTGAKQNALDPALQLLEGKTGTGKGMSDEARQLAVKSGLNAADLTAIRTYTLDDFKYVNPAMANDRKWLKGSDDVQRNLTHLHERAKKQKMPGTEFEKKWRTLLDESDWDEMHDEGREHGQMVLEALTKLPKHDKPTFRGEQLTEDEAIKRWSPKREFATSSFYSTTKNEEIAKHFAQNPPKEDKPIKVVIKIVAKSGRDISSLSAAPDKAELVEAGHKHGEEEVLLPPGTRLRVFNVDKKSDPKMWRVIVHEWNGS